MNASMRTKDFILFLVAILGALAFMLGLVFLGYTTHLSNLDRNQRDERVKIACIGSSRFSSADCQMIVKADMDTKS